MSTKEVMMLISMIGYLLLIVAIGILFGKHNKTSEEFYIGGRGLGPWVTAMSAEASDMSGWLLMGLPGLAYATGLADAAWTAVGLALGTYLNWVFTARPLRIYTQVAKNSITVPDYFSNRFHDSKKILMNIAALFILLFFVVYTASGFVACGKLFASLFGFNYAASMVVSAIIVVVYTVVGGFLAESVVDFVQGTLMFVVLITIVTIGANAAGGFAQVIADGSAREGYLSLFQINSLETGAALNFDIIKILSGLAWGLGYFGMPHVLLRFMAIRDARELKKSRRIGSTWCVISLIMAVLIGIIGRALYPTLLAGAAVENIFIEMCKRLLDTGLLPILAGVMLCGILAAQISSSDSQLLLASSAVAQNFFKGLVKPKATEKEIMKVSRITLVSVAVVAALFALNPNSSVFRIVSFAWAGFGATFGPLIIFSLYWKRINLAGAIAGMVGGGVTVVLWKVLISKLGGIFSVYELLPAFIVSCLCIYIVSKVTAEPSKEIYAEFEEYKRMMKEQ
ncbi:sodium/proline symporter [Hydrogenoanaerobacterium saccharovorans]|uniref:Sodium/proline symporter n=1 Tax=Hydrogenoanaerobacterium saccharovorans TaxID=474960 RepID=A0A1H8BBD6_9FIRM|nr:sodium/proline symporter PutP [Hydrogenoanaerobacterium saccharovorans]RPF47494.1 sodium/proline symporter [Hydrogenoanaerobacterium saccharovorans]SEM80195.1 sodium/proline symporter [Hydrogenoanaerobacterium saccharovorans]